MKKKPHKPARKKEKKPAQKAKKDLLSEVITEITGEDTLPLVKALKNKKNISEFKLAEETDAEVNTTRNRLYRLYEHHLVTFTRKKDKKKGWYIYYWTFNPKRLKDLARNHLKTKIEHLKERITREQTTNFYLCANKCIRLDFDQATEFEYKCPECGEILNQEDNTQRITELKKELQSLEKELSTKI